MMLSNGAYASSETTGTDTTNIDTGVSSAIVQQIEDDSVAENSSSLSSDETENTSGIDTSDEMTLNNIQSTENGNMEHSSAPLRRK